MADRPRRAVTPWARAAWLLLAFVSGLSGPLAPAHAFSGKDSVGYWKNNYQLLSPADEPRVSRAQAIFDELLGVTGAAHGAHPRLLVIQDRSLRVIALPDGWVVLSSGALDQCYRNSALGDDRLAFVLAHEIAHHLKDDFWHMRFFDAVDAYERSPEAQTDALRSVRSIAEKADDVRAKELAADERAIVYAAMAGFDPRAIVNETAGLNFFAEWIAALDPGRLAGPGTDARHPDPDQRAQAVKVRLAAVLDNLAAFELGVWFYEAGLYEEAIASFRAFAVHFPGREVIHNLAVAHYQLALDAFQEWKHPPEFVVSIRLDPQTRAEGLRSRGGEPPAQRFREHVASAIRLAQASIDQDPVYVPGYETLAASLLLDDRPYEAIGALQRALKRVPSSAPLFNALGVAFQRVGDPKQARESFAAALKIDPAYPAVFYNQGRAAWTAGDERVAKIAWGKFLRVSPTGYRADEVRRALGQPSLTAQHRQAETPEEAIMGFMPGMYLEELPKHRRPQGENEVHAGELPYRILRYADGLTAVAYDDKLVMANAPAAQAARSARGIRPGASAALLAARYGTPDRIQPVGSKEVWTYRNAGVAFRLKRGVVRSWLLFRPGA